MPVVILHGRNTVDIDDRLSELLLDDRQGLNTATINIDECMPEDVHSLVSTVGFFGSRRIVVVRGIPGVDKASGIDWDQLEEILLGQPAETTTVIVSYQKIPANRRSLKSANANNWDVELKDLVYGSALVEWVIARGSVNGTDIGDVAAQELLQRLFPTAWQREDRWNPQRIDMQLLATEIDKLASGSTDGNVTVEMVRQLVSDRSGITAFKLNDETFEGRALEALVELDTILTHGEAAERIIGQLGYQPLVLHASRFVQRYGLDTVANVAGISSGQLKATVGRKSGWRNHDGMANAAETLRRSEWLVKTGRSASSGDVIVPLVAEIAEGFNT